MLGLQIIVIKTTFLYNVSMCVSLQKPIGWKSPGNQSVGKCHNEFSSTSTLWTSAVISHIPYPQVYEDNKHNLRDTSVSSLCILGGKAEPLDSFSMTRTTQQPEN